jgi:hypothetical protein
VAIFAQALAGGAVLALVSRAMTRQLADCAADRCGIFALYLELSEGFA